MDQQPTDAQLAKLLWSDLAPLEARHEKAARALVSVQLSLAQETPLEGGEAEFLKLFEQLTQADVDAFTEVWKQPQAYYWTRTAHDLVEACLGRQPESGVAVRYRKAIGAPMVQEALAHHLDDFKIFPLAVAYLTGEPCRFDRPLEVQLPWALPASPWSIESLAGKDTLSIIGLQDGLLLVEQGGERHEISLHKTDSDQNQWATDCPRVTLHRCPTVEHDGCQVRMQPHLFNLPDMADVVDVIAAGIPFQWQHQELLEETLQQIGAYAPEVFDQFRQAMRTISLKPGLGGTSNTSYARLPGTCTCIVRGNSHILAERLIHEFHHNRLFAIEDQQSFFDLSEADAIGDARFYSPWRSDPRPLYGIFHAVYVFVPVCRYWMCVLESAELDPSTREYASSQLATVAQRLQTGSAVLACYAHFTKFGKQLFGELRAEIARVAADVASLGLPENLPALEPTEGGYQKQRSCENGRELTVAEALEEHVRLCDVNRCCEASQLAAV